MRTARLLGGALALCVALAALSPLAVAAVKLPIHAAADKSTVFAKHTCSHDRDCVRYGVLNCRRQSPHVVLCRIFDERKTAAQGKYSCKRLIRVALDPVTRRTPVTGLGRWHC